MIIEKNLAVSDEQFFDVLIMAIIQDVLDSNDKKIDEKDIKVGYCYDKVIRNKRNHFAKATIVKYHKSSEYSVIIKSNSGQTTIDYQIEKIDDSNIRIIYEEEYKNNNGKVTDGFFYRRRVNKRMNLYFNQIIRYINN